MHKLERRVGEAVMVVLRVRPQYYHLNSFWNTYAYMVQARPLYLLVRVPHIILKVISIQPKPF